MTLSRRNDSVNEIRATRTKKVFLIIIVHSISSDPPLTMLISSRSWSCAFVQILGSGALFCSVVGF